MAKSLSLFGGISVARIVNAFSTWCCCYIPSSRQILCIAAIVRSTKQAFSCLSFSFPLPIGTMFAYKYIYIYIGCDAKTKHIVYYSPSCRAIPLLACHLHTHPLVRFCSQHSQQTFYFPFSFTNCVALMYPSRAVDVYTYTFTYGIVWRPSFGTYL